MSFIREKSGDSNEILGVAIADNLKSFTIKLNVKGMAEPMDISVPVPSADAQKWYEAIITYNEYKQVAERLFKLMHPEKVVINPSNFVSNQENKQGENKQEKIKIKKVNKKWAKWVAGALALVTIKGGLAIKDAIGYGNYQKLEKAFVGRLMSADEMAEIKIPGEWIALYNGLGGVAADLIYEHKDLLDEREFLVEKAEKLNIVVTETSAMKEEAIAVIESHISQKNRFGFPPIDYTDFATEIVGLFDNNAQVKTENNELLNQINAIPGEKEKEWPEMEYRMAQVRAELIRYAEVNNFSGHKRELSGKELALIIKFINAPRIAQTNPAVYSTLFEGYSNGDVQSAVEKIEGLLYANRNSLDLGLELGEDRHERMFNLSKFCHYDADKRFVREAQKMFEKLVKTEESETARIYLDGWTWSYDNDTSQTVMEFLAKPMINVSLTNNKLSLDGMAFLEEVWIGDSDTRQNIIDTIVAKCGGVVETIKKLS